MIEDTLRRRNVFVKVFVETTEELYKQVSLWLREEQTPNKYELEIISVTQTEDESGFITLVIFAK